MRINTLLLLCTFPFATLSSVNWLATAANAEFEASAARRIITPDPLLPVTGGMGPSKPATKQQGELNARALVLRNGEVHVAIVSIDALGFPSVLADRVRELVPRIPAENILIGSTHTHSAPDFYAFPDEKGGHTGSLEYMDEVCVKAAAAINEAIDKLQPAYFKSATDKAIGKIAYNYYAPALYDPRASVLQVVAYDDSGNPGDTIATLVNYALHPEVLGNEQGILSPDLIGPLCDRIEAKVGGMAMFMNGAIGGMVTADNRDLDKPSDSLRGVWQDNRTWSECERIGTTLADEALRIITRAQVQPNATLFCAAAEIRLPVESDDLWAVVQHSPLKYPSNDDRSITTRINLVNIGDSQILTIPGEALPNIGYYLKRKMHGKNNLLFGLTNDAFGYIMTKVDFGSFERYDYISRVSLGEMTGELLIDRSLELIEQCPLPK